MLSQDFAKLQKFGLGSFWKIKILCWYGSRGSSVRSIRLHYFAKTPKRRCSGGQPPLYDVLMRSWRRGENWRKMSEIDPTLRKLHKSRLFINYPCKIRISFPASWNWTQETWIIQQENKSRVIYLGITSIYFIRVSFFRIYGSLINWYRRNSDSFHGCKKTNCHGCPINSINTVQFNDCLKTNVNMSAI